MKIHYRKPISHQIIEAKRIADNDPRSPPIDYIEVTPSEMDELKAQCGAWVTTPPWGVRTKTFELMFHGIRIVERM